MSALEREADKLMLTGIQRAVFLARGGWFSGDRLQSSGPLDETTKLAAVCRAHIFAGHTKMAGQCAEALARAAFRAVPGLRGE